MVAKRINKKRNRKFIWGFIILILLIVGAGIYYHAHKSTKNNSSATAANVDLKYSKPGSSSSSTSSASSSGSSSKNPTASTDINQGTAKDEQGQTSTPVTTSPSQWAVSTSKNITVKQPVANSTFQSGDTLSGSATVSRIQYRLIDDQVGVIAQGFLNVVGGNFAGVMQFTSHASTGRLDVFNTNSNGAEINEVQIPVNF